MDLEGSGFLHNLSFSGSGSGVAPPQEIIPLFVCSREFFNNLSSFCRSANLSSTNITAPVATWIIHQSVQKYAPYIAAIEAVYFIIAFFWNLFILLSFANRRKLLQEPAGVYLFSLALTDLFLAVFVVFQCFLTEAVGGFIIGATDPIRCGVCEFLGFMLMFLMTCTLHTLAMLSFDRFFLLIKPLSYRQYFNWRRSLFIVVIIWIFSFVMAVPPLFGFGEYFFSNVIGNCHPNWSGKSYRGIANFDYIVFLAAEAVLPIAFLIFTNMWTYKIVTRVLRSKLKRQRSFSAGNGSAKTLERKTSQSTHNRQQLQLVKVFGALFIAHVMCWTPVLVCVAVGLAIGPCRLPPEVLLGSWVLYLTNPAAHPVLETFFIKDLRLRVYRAHRSVRNSLKRVSSMGSSFRRTLSRRSNKSSESRRNRELSLSSKNSTTLDVGSPVSSDVTSLPECEALCKSRSSVQFSVVENGTKERTRKTQEPEPVLEDVNDSDTNGTDRSYLTPNEVGASVDNRKVKRNDSEAFQSLRGSNAFHKVENGVLNSSQPSITTV